MEKFTEEEFVEIREIMSNQLRFYLPENRAYFDSLEEKDKLQYFEMKDGTSMIVDNPNCIFDNWDAKYHPVIMLLFALLNNGNVTKIDTDKCTPTMIKLLDLMCELKLFNRTNLPNSRIIRRVIIKFSKFFKPNGWFKRIIKKVN